MIGGAIRRDPDSRSLNVVTCNAKLVVCIREKKSEIAGREHDRQEITRSGAASA